jgi:hypothetical protein
LKKLLTSIKRDDEILKNRVRGIRNLCAHGENREELEAIWDLTGLDWSDKIVTLEEYILGAIGLTENAVYVSELAKGGYFSLPDEVDGLPMPKP